MARTTERFRTGGLLQLLAMGVRLYDPKLGRFLEVDPVPGGSANDYDYAGADPINSSDRSGKYRAGCIDDRCGYSLGAWVAAINNIYQGRIQTVSAPRPQRAVND